ncbi:MAG: GIY-YIG nuclease family protein [Candidatus Omnitrophota bacterium]
MYYTYILENKQGGHYIRSSENLAQRIRKHNNNSVRSTKKKGPFRLVYKEGFTTRAEARKRENQIKSYKGNSKFRRLIGNLSVPIV